MRNPWDRVVSCYRGVAHCLARFDGFRAGMPFGEFAEVIGAISDEEADEHFRSQHTFLTDGTGELAIDFLGRFETLDRDFRWVCQELGMPSLPLPRVQAVPTRREYEQYYTAATQRLVGERFADDVRLFGTPLE